MQTNAYTTAKREPGHYSTVMINGIHIGKGNLPVIMAGPCAVGTKADLELTAQQLKEIGIKIMRGGAYKPRTSPYEFQGGGLEALHHLGSVAERYGMVIVTEVVDANDLSNIVSNIPHVILQVGSRNAKNYELLKTLSAATAARQIPVLRKRGECETLDEFLLGAEYLLQDGNPNVLLCLRGVRTWANEINKEYPGLLKTRYTCDLTDIIRLRHATHLPIIFDPSHSIGQPDLIPDYIRAALALGADGVLVDVYPDEELSKRVCDAKQGITIETLKEVLK